MSDIANQPRREGPAMTWLASLLARRPGLMVYGAIAVATLAGWIYLAAMLAAMPASMDMAELGPGMQLFNRLGEYADLPVEVRAGLAALCLPGSATSFGMAGAGSWGAVDLALVYVMWVMMVLAMMLPSAAPMLARYARHVGGSERAGTAVLLLAAGYLSVWCAYSLGATALQWGLHEAQLATAMMVPATTTLAATTLIAAGLYQFTPLKRACVLRCHPPYPGLFDALGEVPQQGAYRAGLRQGLDCMGCCWALMAVMFAVGVMNILWVAVLGVIMVVEKTQPQRWITPLIGVLFLAWGTALLASTGAISSFF